MHTYAVETRNTAPAWRQLFVYGGAHRDDIAAGEGLSHNATYTQIPVASSRAVDPRTERWNGSTDPDACTRPATPEEIAAYDRERGVRRRLAKFDFLRLLTPVEYAAMFGQQSDPVLAHGVALFHAAPDPFDIDDPLVESMLAYCVGSGALTQARKDALWAAMEAAAV